jgi:hypothetical protein
MKNNLFALTVVAGLGFATASLTPPARSGSLSQNAVSEDSEVSTPAIAALRAEGPPGLQALLEAHATLIHQHESDGNRVLPMPKDPVWERLRTALDKVSGQRDCYASRLFWYTDLEQAKAAAKASGKPILSLRLLGRLDEEYSCANSRFFRTTLYANAQVSQYLRDHFILHWKSVRPVPRITIDFGDGRKIERTVTGNSIHYVLDSDGEPIDALPGLYGPKAFLKGLADAEQAARKCASLDRDARDGYLRQYHAERNAAITAAWNVDLAQISNEPNQLLAASFRPPTALAAGNVALGKRAVEMPMLRSFQDLDDATWTKIALLHQDDAALDTGAQTLIRSKNPTAYDASRAAMSKTRYESPFVAMMRNLQRSIAEDTVRNEYVLHSKIHDWFVKGTAPKDLDQLNSKIYAELFLTPDSDPWLGLVPANTFTGLDNNGLVPLPGAP